MRFVNRKDAGRQLAQLLLQYKDAVPIVLGLPRGGVAVAYEVARALKAPLDVWVVRKVGAPDFPELGIGAVAEGGIVYLDQEAIEQLGIPDKVVRQLVRQKSAEVAERVQQLRGSLPKPRIEGQTVILVDDGIATGGTVRGAIQALRTARPRKIVLAVPVAASQSLAELRGLVDDVVCVFPTPELYAIGAWYHDFQQVQDDEVARLLDHARRPTPSDNLSERFTAPPNDPELSIPVGDVHLKAALLLPSSLPPKGLVLFAHASGNSPVSPSNRYIAAVLRAQGLATLLFELLTSEETHQRGALLSFDIRFLARRLVQATDWARLAPATKGLRIGYFGASTGTAAALAAAAERSSDIDAVVSRGGRPDLALESLRDVRAPTLFIVGSKDQAVLELNRNAYAQLTCPRKLLSVPGATHLFEEPGALDAVARLASEWFITHLRASRADFPARAGNAESTI